MPGGLLLTRVNASDDANFGAFAGEEVEPGLRRSDGREPLKRFFARYDIKRLLADGWSVGELRHATTMRWGMAKQVWVALAGSTARDSE